MGICKTGTETFVVVQKQSLDTSNMKAGEMIFSSSSETSIALQKELLETYQRLGRAWLERVQAEMELWTGLASSLASSPSVTASLQSYTETLCKQIQMTAEDGQRLFSDYQEISEKFAKAARTHKDRGSASTH